MVIYQVGRPNHLSDWWRNYIQFWHEATFKSRLIDVENHWWFGVFTKGQIGGFAGCKEEATDTIFLGPCIVHDPFRRKGLQKRLIRTREGHAKKLGYRYVVSCTHFKNYGSSNNFIRGGYRIRSPWSSQLTDSGLYIYWGKQLW